MIIDRSRHVAGRGRSPGTLELRSVSRVSGDAVIEFPTGSSDERQLLLNWLRFLRGAVLRKVVGLTDEQLKGGNMALIFGTAFLLSLLAAYVFGMFLGQEMGLWPSVAAGAAAGICWVAASFGINYLFERRPLRLWLINGGYHALQFTLFGLILGLF